ncbi:hypothetical protein OSTOST_17173, partial [Ostertagia ostertagi]
MLTRCSSDRLAKPGSNAPWANHVLEGKAPLFFRVLHDATPVDNLRCITSASARRSAEEFPEPPSTTPKSENHAHTWEDEDLWEKKFVSPKSEENGGTSEEFPEISSAEVSSKTPIQ